MILAAPPRHWWPGRNMPARASAAELAARQMIAAAYSGAKTLDDADALRAKQAQPFAHLNDGKGLVAHSHLGKAAVPVRLLPRAGEVQTEAVQSLLQGQVQFVCAGEGSLPQRPCAARLGRALWRRARGTSGGHHRHAWQRGTAQGEVMSSARTNPKSKLRRRIEPVGPRPWVDLKLQRTRIGAPCLVKHCSDPFFPQSNDAGQRRE